MSKERTWRGNSSLSRVGGGRCFVIVLCCREVQHTMAVGFASLTLSAIQAPVDYGLLVSLFASLFLLVGCRLWSVLLAVSLCTRFVRLAFMFRERSIVARHVGMSVCLFDGCYSPLAKAKKFGEENTGALRKSQWGSSCGERFPAWTRATGAGQRRDAKKRDATPGFAVSRERRATLRNPWKRRGSVFLFGVSATSFISIFRMAAFLV